MPFLITPLLLSCICCSTSSAISTSASLLSRPSNISPSSAIPLESSALLIFFPSKFLLHPVHLFAFSELTLCSLHLSVNEVSRNEYRIPRAIIIFLRCAAEKCWGILVMIRTLWCWMINREENDDLSVS